MPEYSLKFFCVSGTALSELTARLSQTVSVTGQNEISLDILVASKSVLQVVKNYLVAPWSLYLCTWQQLHQLPDSHESC